MAYTEYIFKCGRSIDHEIHWVGLYGAKGEKREKKKKASPEQIRKQNQWKKELYMTRLIRLNFSPGDYWMTLKYKRGARPPLEQVTKDLRNFMGRLRRVYKKRDTALRWIYRLEIGEKGGVHIHFIVNRIPGEETDRLIKKEWDKVKDSSGIFYDLLRDDEDYSRLASYIVKEPDEEVEKQLRLFDEEERKAFCKYSRSRNMKEPEREVHPYKRRTVKSLIMDGPKPKKGYYIDKSSIRMGTNPLTGRSYCYYTEFKLPQTRINTKCERDFWPPGGDGT